MSPGTKNREKMWINMKMSRKPDIYKKIW